MTKGEKTITSPGRVCLNGHYVAQTPNVNFNFCRECSAEIIDACPSCESPVYVDKFVIKNNDKGKTVTHFVMPYCGICQSPYPWTRDAMSELTLAMEQDSNIPSNTIAEIKTLLPDIVAQTPKTNRAVALLKSAASIASTETVKAISQFVIKAACEYVKNSF